MRNCPDHPDHPDQKRRADGFGQGSGQGKNPIKLGLVRVVRAKMQCTLR